MPDKGVGPAHRSRGRRVAQPPPSVVQGNAMTTPAEVAGALERLVADAQHNALGALHFASAALDVLTQTIQWSPGDEASVTPSAERCRAWLDTGLASVNEMQ